MRVEYVIRTYHGCESVMRNPGVFTVDDPRFSTGVVVGESMLSTDGPRHAHHRLPWATLLRSHEIRRLATASIDRLAGELVEGLAGLTIRAADLRTSLTGPLAVGVMNEILGLGAEPADLWGWYQHIVGGVTSLTEHGHVPDTAAEAMQRLSRAVDAADLRAGTQTPQEVASNAAVVLFGGIETVDGAIANLFWHLMTNPIAYEECLRHPASVDLAIEESFRLEPAASRVDRYATEATSVDGMEIPAGALVIVSIRDANRDPTVFHDPDRFDLHRSNALRHLTFARGPHACLGPRLARAEALAAFGAVTARLGRLELTSGSGPSGAVFRKPDQLIVRWSSAEA
jgi:cytochrome P450